MPLPARDRVKGTPYEERAEGPGLEDPRSRCSDKMGIDYGADQRQRLLVVGHQGPGLAKAICTVHNDTLAKWHQSIPIGCSGMASVPLQFPELPST
jgi:hypothetical protein